MLANEVHRRLRERGRFNDIKRSFCRPRKLRDEVEEYMPQYFRDNPHASTRDAAARDLGIRNHIDEWYVLKDNHLHLHHFQRVKDLIPPTTSFVNSLQVGARGRNSKIIF